MREPDRPRRKRPRAAVVHDIAEARHACAAARETGTALVLWSPPFAAGQMGPVWFREMISLTRQEFPDLAIDAVLDCGDAPGYALAALREGVTAIALAARPAVRRKIAAIAEANGARLVRRRPGSG